MPNYLANFAFTRPESALRPKDQMHGVGTIRIQTDKVPETAEEFQEIAKTIFRANPGQYETVALESLEPTDTFIDDSGDVLEGFVTNE
ncbi:Hypothetical Protein OBI_RACECAR_192 [Arthrobacter phage Racecar]|jgi:hypothetical protein|nr:hypothetical protein PBI_RACECAR_274 [Arthrobacter phage Racecar]QFG12913.1 hypothetical protein PBI_MIMI_271 [Arthrobacter phage Mimi]